MDILSLTKEAEIYNGEKKNSLWSSGAGKTGHPPVKNETRTLFLHHTQQ